MPKNVRNCERSASSVQSGSPTPGIAPQALPAQATNDVGYHIADPVTSGLRTESLTNKRYLD